MIDNPTYAAAQAALHAQFKAGTINETQLADGLETLLNQARLDLSTSGLAKAVVDALALFNAKWSVWDDITGRGSVALVADLPEDGADGDCYWVDEAAPPLYPDGQFWVWFNGLWVAQGDKVTQGRTGAPGSTPNITTGVITTGAPGSAVVVDITGTSPNLVMNVSIPAGTDGSDPVWGLIEGDLSDQADLQAALDGKQAALGFTPENPANKGVANGYAPLGADSKIDSAYIPAVAITDTWEVASQAAMLALSVQKGDVAIRSDENKSYVLSTNSPSTLADWKLLRTPTDVVLSVAGKTGVVTLVKADVGLGNVDNTSDANKPVSTATQTALDGKMPGSYLDTDSTFAADSDTKVPSQKAVKAALALKLDASDAPAGDIVGTTDTQTLTNKTLTSPEVSGALTIDSDVKLTREAANVLALANSTVPQTFLSYNTRTDGSNYERAKFGWVSNVLKIGTEAGGTGSNRSMELQTNGVARLHVTSGWVTVTTTYLGFNGSTIMQATANGVLTLTDWNATGFVRLNLGPASASFPALKRSGTGVQVRLANDSGDGWLGAGYVKTTPLTVAALPAAATAGEGARAFVTDANSTTFAAAAVGGGANKVPVYSDGTSWFIG